VPQPTPHCHAARHLHRRHVPYAFRHFKLPGAQEGFPVWFDINLSQASPGPNGLSSSPDYSFACAVV